MVTSESWDTEDNSRKLSGYDADGNITSESGKIAGITYDYRNLPTRFSLSNGTDVYAAYNAGGRRILKQVAGGAWQFYVNDGAQPLAVITNAGFSHFNITQPGGQVIGRYTASGARRYYITDHLRSTRAVVDDQGTVLETFDYYPGGLLMPKRNTASANTTEKFTGKKLDENTGQYYFGARYYDPALMRFFVPDRFADKYPSMTPYQYAANNPVNFIDVNGDSIDVNQLYEQDKDGNYIHKDQIRAFELFASTKEGSAWIKERAQAGFELSGVVVKDLSIKVDKEGALSKKGIDASFQSVDLSSYAPLRDKFGQAVADFAAGFTEGKVANGRLKQTFSIDDTEGSHTNFILDAVDTFAHETMFHGYQQEQSFLHGQPLIRGSHDSFNQIYGSPHYKNGLSILEQTQAKMRSMGINFQAPRSLYRLIMSGYGY